MDSKAHNPQTSFSPSDILDIFDRAAKAVTDLKNGDDKRVDHLLDTAALAVRGETIAWCEEQGEMALAMFQQRYNAILCREQADGQ